MWPLSIFSFSLLLFFSGSESKDEFESDESSFFGFYNTTNCFLEDHSKVENLTTNLKVTNFFREPNYSSTIEMKAKASLCKCLYYKTIKNYVCVCPIG